MTSESRVKHVTGDLNWLQKKKKEVEQKFTHHTHSKLNLRAVDLVVIFCGVLQRLLL